MKRKYIIGIILLLLANTSRAATITATANGDWTVGTTWSGGLVPGTGDDVIIPVGISVTTPLATNISNYKTLTVQGSLSVQGNLQFDGDGAADAISIYGNLSVTGNINFNQSEADVVTIYSTGTVTVGGNILVSASVAGTGLTIQTGGELYITGSVTYSSSTAMFITNSGYIEVGVDFTGNNATFTNEVTGTIVVHGNISGGGSKLLLNNKGIITVDHSMTLVQTELTNYANAMFVVFGDITFDNGSKFTNSGLVQCNSFVYQGGAGQFYNMNGTLITLVKFDIPTWSGCPCQYDPSMGQFYYNAINAPAGWCGGGVTCSSFLTSKGTPYNPGKMLWLMSDFVGYGSLSDGDKIKRWFDLSNNFGFYMSESNTAVQPIFKNNASENLNYNPVMSFAGGEKHLDLDAYTLYAASGKNGLAMFSVVVPTAVSTGNTMILDFGNRTNNGYGLGYSAQNAYSYTPTQAFPVALGGAINSLAAHGRGSQPTLLSNSIKFGSNQILGINGTDKVTNTITLTQLTSSEVKGLSVPVSSGFGAGGPFTIGGMSKDPTSATYDYEGTIAEILVYAKDLTTSEKEAVQSYLALKYGITLPHDYRSVDGTIVRAVDAVYKNDIAGLAREDIHFLHQRKSHSINANAELTVSTTTIDNSQFNQKNITVDIAKNSSFLIWGHNGADVSSGRRVYKITATNFAQTVSMQFALSGLASAPKLMIADDAAFTSNLTSTTGSYDGTYLTYNTISFTGTKYFKLDLPIKAPGGVFDELSLWLRANNGVENSGSSATDGQVITTWKDASGVRGNNATSTTGTEPSFGNNTSDNINYNPVVKFNGTSSALTYGNDYLYSIASGLSVMGVAKPSVSSSKTSQFLIDFGYNSTAGYGFTYGYENISSYTATAANGLSLASLHPNLNATSIAGFKADYSGKSQYLYLNGTNFSSQTAGTYLTALDDAQINQAATAATTSGPVTIGRQSCTTNLTSNNNRYFVGSLPEIALWTKSLSDVERQRIDSYYAIKYGITIAKDYVCSDGTTVIWNRAANIAYHNDVAGILRDDLSGLLQKQSKSNNTDEIVAIGLGTIASNNAANLSTITNDKQALVWGNNNGSLIANVLTDKPASIAAKMGRVWKVAETGGDLGSLQLNVTIAGGTGLASDYKLLIDTDHDNSFANETPIACTSVSGSVYSFTCNLANNDLFTFGMPTIPTLPTQPGIGINTENNGISIHQSAQLHIYSTNKGVLLPSMTSAEMTSISNPPNGLMIYNTSYNRYMYNAGSPAAPQWKAIGGLLSQTSYELAASTGYYLGEMRYNTTTSTVWYWDGSYWYELQ